MIATGWSAPQCRVRQPALTTLVLDGPTGSPRSTGPIPDQVAGRPCLGVPTGCQDENFVISRPFPTKICHLGWGTGFPHTHLARTGLAGTTDRDISGRCWERDEHHRFCGQVRTYPAHPGTRPRFGPRVSCAPGSRLGGWRRSAGICFLRAQSDISGHRASTRKRTGWPILPVVARTDTCGNVCSYTQNAGYSSRRGAVKGCGECARTEVRWQR